MKRSLLAVALLSPLPLWAQQAAAPHRWLVEGGVGLSYSSSATRPNAIGPSYALSVGRTLTDRVTLRAATELSSWKNERVVCVDPVYTVDNPDQNPQRYCTSTFGGTVASLSVGADVVALGKRDRGLYLSGRLGGYMLGDAPGYQGGAYVGAGFAVPTSVGAVTVETGVHGYFGAPRWGESWVVPVRLGFRWRP